MDSMPWSHPLSSVVASIHAIIVSHTHHNCVLHPLHYLPRCASSAALRSSSAATERITSGLVQGSTPPQSEGEGLRERGTSLALPGWLCVRRDRVEAAAA